MTAKGTKMKTGWKVLLWVAAGAVAGGCASNTKLGVVQDPGPARTSRAAELALEAQRAQKAGQTDKALDLYQQSLAQSQDLYFVWNNLGLLLMEKHNYMNAAEMFKSAADLAPGDPRPYYNIGLIYKNQGHDKDALDYFSRSLLRDARYLPSLRGAITVAKYMDLSDDASLTRVKTGLMLETDPKWRELFERESLRIQGSTGRTEAIVPVEGSQKEFEARWRELQNRPVTPPPEGEPLMLPEPAGGTEPAGSGGGAGD